MPIHEKLRELRYGKIPFAIDSLAEYFGLPKSYFSQKDSPGSPIVFHQADLLNRSAAALSGCIFWPEDREIIPGIPRPLLSSDHSDSPLSARNDFSLIDSATNGEAVIESLEPGLEARLYVHNGRHYFATRAAFDGSSGLYGAGIENPRKLGITVSSEAMKICRRDYPGAFKLASLGYVAVFSLLIPERDDYVRADRPGLIFTDAIDPDFEFADRLEKERIAEDYGLSICALVGRLIRLESPAAYYGRLRALEIEATQYGTAGCVVKSKSSSGERLAVLAEPNGGGSWNQEFSESEIEEAYDAISDDFGREIEQAEQLEELLLEYLGSRRRSVRRQILKWLEKRGPSELPQ